MRKFFKQPNGKYCYFSYNGIGGFNLTESDIKEIYVSEAEEDIKNAENFGGIIKELLNKSNESSDDFLKLIGFNEPYKELVKYVPRRPVDSHYVSCDFTTYAKCPNCNKTVQDGIGFKEEKCGCGQMLKWN
jgi:hypothetical protein